MERSWKHLTLSLFFLSMSVATVATAATNAGVTYQGRILKPDGSPLEGATVQFRLQLRTPGSQNCLMFEEVQLQDMRNSKGNFSITMNDGTGSRTDTTLLGLDKVFANRGAFTFDPATCSTGNSYTPNSDDGRKLVVYFKDETMAQWEPMPAQSINFVPYAFETKQVAGFSINQLMRFDLPTNSLKNTSPLSEAEFDKLTALIAGTSGDYTRAGRLGNSVLPTMGSGQVLGWTGSAWESVDTVPTNSVTTAKILDANVTTAKIADGNVTGTKIAAGTITSTNLAPNISISTTGTVASGVATTRELKLYDQDVAPNENSISFKAPASIATDYSLTWPATAGASNQVLTTNGSGVLTWAAPANSSQWTTTGNNIYYDVTGGNVGVGTNAPTAKLDVQQVRTVNTGSAYAVSGINSVELTANQTVGRTSGVYGASSIPATSTYNVNDLQGMRAFTENLGSGNVASNTNYSSRAINSGTGTTAILAGSLLQIEQNAGSVTSLHGLNAKLTTAGGTVQDEYGLRTNSAITGGTVQNRYGLHLIAAGTATNDFGVYQATPAVKNFFAGNVGIGTASPSTKLDVAGSIRVGDGAELCNATTQYGAIRYNTGNIQFCNASGWQTVGVSGSGMTSLTGDVTATGPGASAATVVSVGTSSAANVHTAELLANAATSAGTIDTIVRRDSSGRFVTGGATFTSSVKVKDGAAGGEVTIAAPTGFTSYGLTLPTTAGAASQVLTTNGAGILSWTTPTVGTGDFKKDGTVAMTGDITLSGGEKIVNGGDVVSIYGTRSLSIDTNNAIGMPVLTGTGGGVAIGNSMYMMGASPMLFMNSANSSFSSIVQSGSTMNIVNGSGDIYIKPAQRVGIGATAPHSYFDIANGNLSMTLGADKDQNTTRTANTAKASVIESYPYDNGLYGNTVISTLNDATNATVNFGGGTGYGNAATQLKFYTAANTSTNIGSERMRIDNAGNLGIGTTAPLQLLDVNGAIRIGTTATCGSTVGGTIRYLSGNIDYCDGTSWKTLGVASAGITALTGDVTATGPGSAAATVATVGTSTAANIHAAELLANAATSAGTIDTIVKRASDGRFVASGATFTSSLKMKDGAAGGEVTIAAPTGFTSYGLTLPTTAGTAGYALTTNGSGALSWTNPASSGPWTVAGSDIYRATGNVGIGASSPSTLLHLEKSQAAETAVQVNNFNTGAAAVSQYVLNTDTVYSALKNFSAAGGGATQLETNGSILSFKTNVASPIVFSTNGNNERMRVSSTGSVGIGTNAPNAALDVKGSIVMSGSTSGYTGFKAPAVAGAGTMIYQLPSVVPTAGQVLSSDASGVLSWTTASGGGSTIDSLTDARTTATSIYLGTSASTGSAIESVGVGIGALNSITTGIANTVVGSQAGYNLTTQTRNTYIGWNSGWSTKAGANGSSNTFVGYGSGYGNTSTIGKGNTAIGDSAFSGGTGDNNTALGQEAYYNGTGDSNTLLGKLSGYASAGSGNISVGFNAGAKLSGGDNVAIGQQALFSNGANQSAARNTVVGNFAYGTNTTHTGSDNAIVGYNAANALTSGANNVLLGSGSGSNLTTGSNNILIGKDIASTAANRSNYMSIGNLIYGDITNGKVGINNPAPAYPMHVMNPAGLSIVAESWNSTSTGIGIYNTSTGGHNYEFYSTGQSNGVGPGLFGIYDQTANNTPLAINGANGVINTMQGGMFGFTPDAKFAGPTGDTAIARNAAGVIEINNGTSGTIRDIRIRAINPTTGNVGIGLTAPVEKLEVSGNIVATSYLYSSDRRLKKQIVPIQTALEKVLQLNGVTYRWIKPLNADADREQMGVIAQEVELVFPQAVTVSADGTKRVNYPMLVAPVIEAVKELNSASEQQSRSIASLEARALSAESKVHELEKKLEQKNADFEARIRALERSLRPAK